MDDPKIEYNMINGTHNVGHMAGGEVKKVYTSLIVDTKTFWTMKKQTIKIYE